MKMNERRVRFVLITLCATLLVVMFSLNAFAISKPGLDFEFEFRPDPHIFPDSVKESNPAVYEAHKALLHFPEDLKKMESQMYEQELSILHNKDIDTATKRDMLAEAREKHKAAVTKLKADKAEMRRTFLFLATDALKNDANPHIMLSVAQQYYELRNQDVSVMKNAIKASEEEARKAALEAAKAEEEAKKAAEAEKNATEEKAEQIAEKTEEPVKTEPVKTEPVKMEVKQPTGNPSLAISSDYKSNLELVLSLCKEINDRFSSFDYMPDVKLLIASAYYAQNKKEQAVSVWKAFLKKYSGDKHEGQVLYQLANYEFKSTRSFDHFTTAAEIYAKAVNYFKPGKTRWRIMYKHAWATFLSPDLSEDSKALFVKLYKEMAAQKSMSEEMMLIKVEILEVIRQISGINSTPKSGSMFGK